MESTTITPAPERAVDAPTVTEALRRTAASHPDLVAVRTADDEISLTWSQLLGGSTRSPAVWPGSAWAAATRSRSCSATAPSSTSPTWQR